MTINETISRLIALREKHGDVDVSFDCPQCGTTSAPTRIEIGPPVVKLQVKR